MDIVLDEKLTASLMKDVHNWEVQFGKKVLCSQCLNYVELCNCFKNNGSNSTVLSFGLTSIGYYPFSITIHENKFSGIYIYPSISDWHVARKFSVHKNKVIISMIIEGATGSQMEINNIQELLSLIKHTISETIDESNYKWETRKQYFDFLYNMTFWDAMMGNGIDEEIVIEI